VSGAEKDDADVRCRRWRRQIAPIAAARVGLRTLLLAGAIVLWAP
jgi:hypothetical protein